MDNDTTGTGNGASDATLLLDLDGLAVQSVEWTASGARLVRLVTADECAAACPGRGVISMRVKEYACTRPRDLPQGLDRVDLVWHKRRWYCCEPLCRRQYLPDATIVVNRFHIVKLAGDTVTEVPAGSP